MPQPKAVLLDIDGTLIDSNRAHAEAYVEAGRQLGLSLDIEDVRRRIGKGGDKLIPEVSGLSEEEGRGADLAGRKKKLFLERWLPRLKPTPGARPFLHRLRDDGLKLVIATSAGREEMQQILEQAGVADLVQDATSSDDAEESKPDPDIVLAALGRAGYPAPQVLMLGDTPYDVEAARRAGVGVVALRCGGWSDADLRGALAVYEHPQDLLDNFDDSPFGRGH